MSITEELENRLAKLEALKKRMQQYEDRHEIQRLLYMYGLNHSQKNMHKTVQFYDFDQKDASIEIADRGNFVGEKNVRMVFEGDYQIQMNQGNMLMHWQMSPMIEVAKDGKTARGILNSLGSETIMKDGKPIAVWNFINWAVDFIKDKNGQWKFWHYRVLMDMKCDFDKGWIRDFYKWDYMGKMKGATTDLPMWNNCYSPGGYLQRTIPACPRPYETWDNEKWIFEEEPDFYRVGEENDRE